MATEDQRSNRNSTEQHTSSGGITITNNRVIRFLFTNKNIQHAVNLITVAIFFYAIDRAAVGPTDSGTDFGNVAFFSLWWTPIMLLSLVFLGLGLGALLNRILFGIIYDVPGVRLQRRQST